jgi:hypothetical protein
MKCLWLIEICLMMLDELLCEVRELLDNVLQYEMI